MINYKTPPSCAFLFQSRTLRGSESRLNTINKTVLHANHVFDAPIPLIFLLLFHLCSIQADNCWLWKFDGSEMFYHLQDEIRIRVLQVQSCNYLDQPFDTDPFEPI